MTFAESLPVLLRRRVDPVLEHLMGRVGRVELRDPFRRALAPALRQAMQRTAARYVPPAAELGPAVARREAPAVAAFDALAAEALASMRATTASCDRTGLLARLDRALYRDVPELMDDPSFPEAERAESLDLLHRFNTHLGSYDAFVAMALPLVEMAEARGRTPVVMHDLAAGHAGFSVFLKRRLGERVRAEASDIRPEYLELGRARALAENVEVKLLVEDALALADLRERGVDVVTTTQSMHHFGPGMVARMIGEAARAARVGVCFIDGERSLLALGLLATAVTLYGRMYAFMHDGIVSIRRMYYAEELSLLAALAPGVPEGARVETGTAAPAHVFLRITLPRGAEA